LRHVDTAPPDVRQFNRGLPREVVTLLERMLAKKPEQRYQTPVEILADLNRLERGQGPKIEDRESKIENRKSRIEEGQLRIEQRGSRREEDNLLPSSIF